MNIYIIPNHVSEHSDPDLKIHIDKKIFFRVFENYGPGIGELWVVNWWGIMVRVPGPHKGCAKKDLQYIRELRDFPRPKKSFNS